MARANTSNVLLADVAAHRRPRRYAGATDGTAYLGGRRRAGEGLHAGSHSSGGANQCNAAQSRGRCRSAGKRCGATVRRDRRQIRLFLLSRSRHRGATARAIICVARQRCQAATTYATLFPCEGSGRNFAGPIGPVSGWLGRTRLRCQGWSCAGGLEDSAARYRRAGQEAQVSASAYARARDTEAGGGRGGGRKLRRDEVDTQHAGFLVGRATALLSGGVGLRLLRRAVMADARAGIAKAFAFLGNKLPGITLRRQGQL